MTKMYPQCDTDVRSGVSVLSSGFYLNHDAVAEDNGMAWLNPQIKFSAALQ